MQDALIRPTFIGKLFGSIRIVELSLEGISIVYKRKAQTFLSYSDLIDVPSFESGFFGGVITLKTPDNIVRLTLLNQEGSDGPYTNLKSSAIQSLAKRITIAVGQFKYRAANEYLRDSSIDALDCALLPIISSYRESASTWNESFSSEITQPLASIEKHFPLSSGKDAIRKSYEMRRLTVRHNFYDGIESNPLTDQQRLSVIRNNDRNLVLAAAGTGKTSVMVAKALDLIDTQEATKDEIVILAYNRAAAGELRERVLLRGSSIGISEECCPSISTFHALGMKILRESNIPTYLSEFSEDPIKLLIWVTQWLIDYIKCSPETLKNFIHLSYQPVNPFEFRSKEEYDAYIRDNEYRTLQGERVKGYQELLIANWLFLNGIEYEYEAPYISKRRIEIGFDYRPDFHIKNSSIYIEHFGIDRSANTRPDIDRQKYNVEMQKKRLLHEEYGTTLFETYHYDWIEGALEDRLESQMNDSGIGIVKKSHDEMFETLNELGFIEAGAKRYLKCLEAIRVERLDKDAVYARLKEHKIVNAKEYTELLGAFESSYTKELRNQGRIDFDDMIIRSTNAIKEGLFKPRWKHILVDEFQDISMARMDLIEALIAHGPDPRITVVGDDWQSIYRFSGGKLELTTRFEKLVGSHSLTKLEKTFRYNNSIADTAGTFVMQNPEQYQKQVVTHDLVDKSQVYLLDSKVDNENDLEARVVQIIKAIRKNDAEGSIAVLARYNYLIRDVKQEVKTVKMSKGLKYWTFHGSKGLEADYCILVGFFQGKTGFPNKNKEEAVVEALLPSLDTYPHSEERRLLYVAITRARKKCYLVADPMAPSEFIVELLSPRYKLHIASKTFEERYRNIFKCPQCTTGHFRLVSGKFGEFYSCSSGSVCRSKPRKCERCGSPSLDVEKKSVCNNSSCENELSICDRCGRPMRLREGRFGKFWGCSGYGIKDDQCKHTRKYFGI
jgi:DNA helicase-4